MKTLQDVFTSYHFKRPTKIAEPCLLVDICITHTVIAWYEQHVHSLLIFCPTCKVSKLSSRLKVSSIFHVLCSGAITDAQSKEHKKPICHYCFRCPNPPSSSLLKTEFLLFMWDRTVCFPLAWSQMGRGWGRAVLAQHSSWHQRT